MKEILPQAIEVLAPLLMALLGWFSFVTTRWINARIRNEYLKGALLRLDDAVYIAVRAVQQTVVDDLRAKADDGKITPREATEAKNRAVQSVKDYLGAKGLAELQRVLDLDAITRMIEGKVETAVHELKDGGVS